MRLEAYSFFRLSAGDVTTLRLFSPEKRKESTNLCYWDVSPIGSKHCHYEKIVDSCGSQHTESGNQVVDGTGFRQSFDNTAVSFLSFDDGKTWQGNSDPSDTVAAKVHVGGQRAAD